MAKANPVGAWESITPAKAEKWLNELNTNNRKLREGVAEKYAEDMKHGRWLPNPQPIMFFDDGSLADGQHRLWAICESGVTVQMYVVRGVDKGVALNIDTGMTRKLVDNARIAGQGTISHTVVAMSKVIHFGTYNGVRGLSNGERLELIRLYEPHLAFADQRMPRKRYVGNALMGAAIARAHMHEKDLDRLTEFCEVLSTGMPKNTDDGACIAIRNYLLENAGSLKDSRDTFLKCQNAIRYFMRRKGLSVIKGVKDEAYPLSGAFAKAAEAATVVVKRKPGRPKVQKPIELRPSA